MSKEIDFEKYTLTDRDNSLRQNARKYRKIYDKDYPQPDLTKMNNNLLTFDEKLDNLKNIIRITNLEYDNIRPIFINIEIPKK
jgi:hypothetical protein